MTAAIHPTAIVHPNAKLAEGVRIGPYAIIEGPAEIGEGCLIQAHAILTGHVRMGSRNTIGYGALIGADPQDYSFQPSTESWVVIGDDNRIREYVTIHRGTKPATETRVGNHCFLMAGVHLAHNTQVADRVVIANNALLGGYVEIETGVFIGGGSVFHQFIRVGRQAMVRGNCAFSKDIPPFVIAAGVNSVAGLNAVGLRRGGFTAFERQEIRTAFKLLYRSGLNISQALQAASERTWGPAATEFFAFAVAAKRRGLCGLFGTKRGEPPAEEEA